VRAVASLHFLEENNIDKSLCGNWVKKDGLDIEQDKVIPISEYLKRCAISEGKNIINEFIALNKVFVRKGFIDKSFNICKNFGIDEKNNVILIDIGELYNDIHEIKE